MNENKKPWRSHQGKGLPKVAKHHRWKFIDVGPALCGEHRNYRCHDCSLEVSVLIETSTVHRLQRPTRYHCKINGLEPDCAIQIVKKVLESLGKPRVPTPRVCSPRHFESSFPTSRSRVSF